MPYMTPGQLRVNWDAQVAKATKDREDAARLTRERTDITGLLDEAKANKVEKLFAALHETLSPHFHSAAPFRGALVFYTGLGKSVLRVFPGDAERVGIVRFEVDLVGLATAVSAIFPVKHETVLKALPPLSAGPGSRWRSGTFESGSAAGGIAGLFRSADKAAYNEELRIAGDIGE